MQSDAKREAGARPPRWRKHVSRAALSALLLGACAVELQPARNLVLISLDTVRRDHLPTYGYGRATAPAVDGLARRGAVFENAFAQDTNTTPSHASMFTGLYPHVHGSTANDRPLAEGPATLAQILQEAGFVTAGFVSGSTLKSYTGLQRGFATYDDDIETERRDGRLTSDRALAWLAERRPDERYFLFLHLYDAHGPRLPQGSYAELFQSPDPGPELENIPGYQRVKDEDGHELLHLNEYVDRYDATIRYVDDLVGEVLARLDLSDTLVVVLSDHGETLGERFWVLDHGAQLFDEQIRIPLVVAGAGVPVRRIGTPVETVDLLPTLLELLDLPLPEGLVPQGRSLVPLLRGKRAQSHPVFSAARPVPRRYADRGYKLDPERRIHSIRSPRWKLVRYPGRNGADPVELYDLEQDPGERHNVADAFPKERDARLAELQAWYASRPATESPPGELPDEVRESLEALGYLDD